MKLAFALLLLIAALTAAGAARADGWCGESSDAACQPDMAYVECNDGTIWLVDPGLVDDVDAYAEILCSGYYTVLTPPDESSAPPATPTAAGGPYDLDPNMAPDPSEYVGEVECPDGRVWAVARGDQFVCPP